jgi:hypothetical protein
MPVDYKINSGDIRYVKEGDWRIESYPAVPDGFMEESVIDPELLLLSVATTIMLYIFLNC